MGAIFAALAHSRVLDGSEIGLIGLDNVATTTKRWSEGALAHGLADAMGHEPS
jgi:hypothetical protein